MSFTAQKGENRTFTCQNPAVKFIQIKFHTIDDYLELRDCFIIKSLSSLESFHKIIHRKQSLAGIKVFFFKLEDLNGNLVRIYFIPINKISFREEIEKSIRHSEHNN